MTTSVDEVLAQRSGVCQDFAHVMIACLRSHGLPARYVSGYLLTQPPPGRPRLLGADVSHAWVAAYSPHHGWVEFDPTNDTLADRRYITLATGADFADVVPLRGVILGGRGQTMKVAVSVVPQLAAARESPAGRRAHLRRRVASAGASAASPPLADGARRRCADETAGIATEGRHAATNHRSSRSSPSTPPSCAATSSRRASRSAASGPAGSTRAGTCTAASRCAKAGRTTTASRDWIEDFLLAQRAVGRTASPSSITAIA